MKKTLLFIIVTTLFMSCNKGSESEIHKVGHDGNSQKIGALIDSVAVKYPNFKNNQAQKEKFNIEIKNAFADSLRNDSFLKGYKFKLLGVKSVGDGYTLNLLFNDSYGGSGYSGNFNIIAVTNKNYVEALIEGKNYMVNVEFIGYYNDKMIYQLDHAGNLYTPMVGYFNNSVDFGVVVANLDSIY